MEPQRDNLVPGEDDINPHASSNRGRHQESNSYRPSAAPRQPDEREGSKWLSDYLNTSRVESPKSSGSGASKAKPVVIPGDAQNGGEVGHAAGDTHGTLVVKCGPLLNYRRMENETWYGSVLVVTEGGGMADAPERPELRLKAGPAGQSSLAVAATDDPGENAYGTVDGVDYSSFQQPEQPQDGGHTNGSKGFNGHNQASQDIKVGGTKLYSDSRNTFWRFDLEVALQQEELKVTYEIPGLVFSSDGKRDKQSFFIPAITESMRIMFHSCNGFSVGTDEEAYSGACLWNDVQRVHAQSPFHVMYV